MPGVCSHFEADARRTLARAEDAPNDEKGGEMKPKNAKKSKKKDGDMGAMKKGDMDKK